MKIYIGPYRDWIGPYQIADKLFFWLSKDKRFEIGARMAGPDGKDTWLQKVCVWVESHKKRKVKIRIDKYDTWSMDHTLALIILPMLKQLHKTKHGAPCVDDEDVPEGLGLRSTEAPPKENDYDIDDNHFKRWDWIMDEMIFAFDHHINKEWEEAYRSGEFDHKSVACKWDENGKPKLFRLEEGPNHTYKADYEGMRVVEDRIKNGFRLFGKYYQGLWD